MKSLYITIMLGIIATLVTLFAACNRIGCLNYFQRSPAPSHESKNLVLDGKVAILERLREAPPWTKITTTNEAHDLLTAISFVCSYDIDQVREAVKIFNEENETNIEQLSKIYVLNRYVFFVTANQEVDTARVFGGWSGVPINGKTVNMLWPLTETDFGLELAGRFRGYRGEVYNGLREFDFFLRTYGERKKVKH